MLLKRPQSDVTKQVETVKGKDRILSHKARLEKLNYTHTLIKYEGNLAHNHKHASNYSCNHIVFFLGVKHTSETQLSILEKNLPTEIPLTTGKKLQMRLMMQISLCVLDQASRYIMSH